MIENANHTNVQIKIVDIMTTNILSVFFRSSSSSSMKMLILEFSKLKIWSIITSSSSSTRIQCWDKWSWLEKSKTRFSDKWSFRSRLAKFYSIFVFHMQRFSIQQISIQQTLIQQISIQQISIERISIWQTLTLISWLDFAISTTLKLSYVDDLNSMTFVQALMHQLADEDWFFAFQKDRRNQINHFFFAKKSSQIILRTNYEVLVMNCIYKTNKYKMSFFIINDQIVLHKSFYVAFCFMSKKKQNDYMWVLQQLRDLYANWKFLIQQSYSSTWKRVSWKSWLIVLLIDMKRFYECLSFDFFLKLNHLLCLWYINNKILINCKKHFIIKEIWNKFFSE